MIGHTPSATGTHSSNRSFSPESDNSLGSVLDDSGDSSPDQQGVFLTQVSVCDSSGGGYTVYTCAHVILFIKGHYLHVQNLCFV